MLTKVHCFPDSTESYYCTHKCSTPESDEITQINPRTSSARSHFDISDRSRLLAEETPHGSNWAVFTDGEGLVWSVGMVFDPWLPLLATTSSTVHSRGPWLFCTHLYGPSVWLHVHLEPKQTDIRNLPKIHLFQQVPTSH